MPFTRSGDVLAGVMKQLGLDERTEAVMKIWDKELGPLSRGVKLVGIKDGKLIAVAESNVHLQEAVLRRRELVKKLNQYLGGGKFIKGIRLTLK